jgi:hypothetical protein
MLVDRGARLTRQLRKADRLTLTAKISKAPFNRFVMRASGLVVANGAAACWTFGAASQMTACNAPSRAAR